MLLGYPKKTAALRISSSHLCKKRVHLCPGVWNPEESRWVAMPDDTLAKLQQDCGAYWSHQGKQDKIFG
jgi:hypothetical protein